MNDSESLAMAARAEAGGFSDIIATPHIRWPLASSTVDLCRRAHTKLAGQMEAAGHRVKLHLGAEVEAHPEVISRLEKGAVFTLAGGNFLLLEAPLVTIPKQLPDLIFKLRINGIIPVLAHPERTIELQRNRRVLKPCLQAGCRIQIDAGSLVGVYGREAKNSALAMLKEGVVHFIASDAHRSRSTSVFGKAIGEAAQIVGLENAKKLVTDNPAAILETALTASKP